jgi:hypothetical protein
VPVLSARMDPSAHAGLSEPAKPLSWQLSYGARCLSGCDWWKGRYMQPTTVASWAAVIWRALEARDIAPQPVFERAGVDASHLHDAGARIPLVSA